MMKRLVIIPLLFILLDVSAQTDEQKLAATIREFHIALIAGNTISINQQTDKALSYGHSNGWVETKQDMIKNLETGFMKYNSYREDSLQFSVNGAMANARFIAEINATLNGNTASYKLRVLEVWVKKGKRWILFGRQAVRYS